MSVSDKDVKQVIVMRKDLNMRKGKMCAQASHASMSFLTRNMRDTPGPVKTVHLDEAAMAWIDAAFTKVVVSVNSEEELLAIYQKAQDLGILSSLIRDAGRTEFGGVPTYTCVAVGPALITQIDAITGHLPLL